MGVGAHGVGPCHLISAVMEPRIYSGVAAGAGVITVWPTGVCEWTCRGVEWMGCGSN
jgi:hypothetical protein